MATRTVLGFAAVVGGAAILAAGCSDPLSPRGSSVGVPVFATTAPTGAPITLDQNNGSLAAANTAVLLKGFNPTNPHTGDAIVATFFWTGSTNIITGVIDHLANGTPVGNTYTLVDYYTAGGLSMASYVAINVQNFPDAYGVPGGAQDSILAIEADLSQPVSHGGVQITAYTGVGSVAALALGAHASTDGTGSGITPLGPAPVPVGAGTLVHAVALTNGIFGYDLPAGFGDVGEGDNAVMKEDAADFVASGVGTVQPQWNWYYDAGSYSWLATAITLSPPPHLVFTTPPVTTLPLLTMASVRASAMDGFGNVVTGFTDAVTIAIGKNGGVVMPGTLSGTLTVTAVNGVASFS